MIHNKESYHKRLAQLIRKQKYCETLSNDMVKNFSTLRFYLDEEKHAENLKDGKALTVGGIRIPIKKDTLPDYRFFTDLIKHFEDTKIYHWFIDTEYSTMYIYLLADTKLFEEK